MRARTRRKLLGISIVTGALAFVLVWIPFNDDWFVVLKASLFAAAFASAVVWIFSNSTSPYRAPDILSEKLGGGTRFDANGLTIAPNFSIDEGLCWIDVFYQNRYTSPCRAYVFIVPMEGVSRNNQQPHEVPPVTAEIECGGGEVGVISQPLPVAPKWQGKIMIFDVYAVASFSDSQREEIRRQDGFEIGGPNDDTAALLAMAALLPLGILYPAGSSGGGGKMELRLPENVLDTTPPAIGPRSTILWEMQLPTGGFPVLT